MVEACTIALFFNILAEQRTQHYYCTAICSVSFTHFLSKAIVPNSGKFFCLPSGRNHIYQIQGHHHIHLYSFLFSTKFTMDFMGMHVFTWVFTQIT